MHKIFKVNIAGLNCMFLSTTACHRSCMGALADSVLFLDYSCRYPSLNQFGSCSFIILVKLSFTHAFVV